VSVTDSRGEPSGVEQLFDLTTDVWERANVTDARDRTYVRYDGAHYAMAVAILDQIPVNSLPDGRPENVSDRFTPSDR
jgi:hypothetical protein